MIRSQKQKQKGEQMPIHKKRETPVIGYVFERKYHNQIYRLKVINSGTGVAYELNGKTFKTPTAAAKSLTNSEVNGWEFWERDLNK